MLPGQSSYTTFPQIHNCGLETFAAFHLPSSADEEHLIVKTNGNGKQDYRVRRSGGLSSAQVGA